MPAPAFLAPIAWKLAKFGAVAALTAIAVRRAERAAGPAAPQDAWRARALDGVADGVEADYGKDGDGLRADAAGRWRGVVRIGRGRGVAVDLAGLARMRLRRI